MDLYTDYPIHLLGDEPYQEAPIRKCEILNWDGDKYCDVLVEGVVVNFKAGYIYTEECTWKQEHVVPLEYLKTKENIL
jgi:hypothetical protein